MGRNEYLKELHRVVIKVGTTSITKGGSGASSDFMDSIARQVKALKDKGIEALIVTSGAIGIGLSTMNARSRSREIPIRQAAASIGQSVLMQKWNDSFQKFGIAVAQILLTFDFYSDREKYLNLRNAIQTILEYKAVPIFNENDAICVKEIDAVFGDNDTLSAMVSIKMDADLLIILSDVDGLYDKNPKLFSDAKLISAVNEITDDIRASAGDTSSKVGTGGMRTKIRAAEICHEAGCNMIIASSDVENVIERIISGEEIGTIFLADKKERKKSRWIRYAHASGSIEVDEGAKKALAKHVSLLAIGIKAVTGRFDRGDVVNITCGGKIIAKGIPDYNSDDISKIKGLHSDKLEEALGHKNYDNVIRSENIVLM
ncbi:MAG: glutamate 5-kinase [Methanomassiliicoccaceae archaeon]|jgi:glutamate 5-kinase|nr:glutamate 5-kinase [Methanomassiliicoccaceae archaeon]